MPKFLFLVLPEVHLLDLAGPNQVISEAIDLGADFEIEYCGIEEEILTSAHLGINKLNHFSKTTVNAGDYIVIPGSHVKFLSSFDFKSNRPLIDWILEMHKKG